MISTIFSSPLTAPRLATRAITGHLIKAAGYDHETAQTGAVTLIQRFGSALNLNIHFHMLFLDGAYVGAGDGLRAIKSRGFILCSYSDSFTR